MDNIEFLKDLKTRIDNAKESKARLEGSLETLHNTLKKEFGVDTIEDGIKLLSEMEEKMATKEKRLNRAISSLKAKMEKFND